MGAAACFVRTMTGAGGLMRGQSALPRAALLMLRAYLCVAGAVRCRACRRSARPDVQAACIAAAPAAKLRALGALCSHSGL
jgi:hypothetical protein